MPVSLYTLVVDDNHACLEALHAALTLHGHSVVTATCPEEAEQLLADEWPDVLICDLLFQPGSPSIDVLTDHPLFSQIPCRILLTAVDSDSVPEEIADHFNQCVCKTVPVRELLRLIQSSQWPARAEEEESQPATKQIGADSAFFKLS